MSDYDMFIFSEFKSIFTDELKKTPTLEFESLINRLCIKHDIKKSDVSNLAYLRKWFRNITEQEYLDSILSIDQLQEIIFHTNSVYDEITNHGKRKVDDFYIDANDFEQSFAYLARKKKVTWNYAVPFASFNTQVGSSQFRITLIHSSITQTNSPKVFIRKISSSDLELSDFCNDNHINQTLRNLVSQKKNILISGSTASGKTTFLKCLARDFDSNEHIIVIEDTHELPGAITNYTHLLAQDSDGKSMKDYCAYALRMSPERMILGEIRSQEVVPFILSMNTGHKGLMSTIHANDAKDTLLRMSMLFSLYSNVSNAISHDQILKLICSNIDYVVHLKHKQVNEVIKVNGSEGSNPIFNYCYQKQPEQSDLHNYLNAVS
jgi:Flp pilus assembly CpaF family ATPase